MSNETTPTTTDDGAAAQAMSPAQVPSAEVPGSNSDAPTAAAEAHGSADEAPPLATAQDATEAATPAVGNDAPASASETKAVGGNHRLAAIASAASAAADETRKLWDRYAPSRTELAQTLQGLNTKVASSGQSARRVLDQVTEKISRRLELATVPSTSKFKQGAARLQSMAQHIRVPDLATLRGQAGAVADRLHLAELTSSVSARLGIGGAAKGEKPAGKAKVSAKAKAPAKRKAAPRKAASANSSSSETESAAVQKKPTRARTTAGKATGTTRRAAAAGAAGNSADAAGPDNAATPRAPRKRAPRKAAAVPAAPADTRDPSSGKSETP